MAETTKRTMRQCIGSERFGIKPHKAPVEDFPVQPSQKDGLGRMCKPHWRKYTAGLARDAKARTAAAAAADGAAPADATPAEEKPPRQSRRAAKAQPVERQSAETEAVATERIAVAEPVADAPLDAERAEVAVG